MIRSNDPKLTEIKGEVFNEEDFEVNEEDDHKKSSKPLMTYKDQIRQDVLNKAKKGNDNTDESEEEG
jgi:hypothetical protein